MKIKLLVDVSNTKAGEIVDAIFENINVLKWGYFFEGSSLTTIRRDHFEVVKDEPIAQVEATTLFNNYENNFERLILEVKDLKDDNKILCETIANLEIRICKILDIVSDHGAAGNIENSIMLNNKLEEYRGDL